MSTLRECACGRVIHEGPLLCPDCGRSLARAGYVLKGDRPGEGVDTVRWSDPWPMVAVTLVITTQVPSGRPRRQSSTQSRRARRTAAAKGQRRSIPKEASS